MVDRQPEVLNLDPTFQIFLAKKGMEGVVEEMKQVDYCVIKQNVVFACFLLQYLDFEFHWWLTAE